jgi:hypothetical protein
VISIIWSILISERSGKEREITRVKIFYKYWKHVQWPQKEKQKKSVTWFNPPFFLNVMSKVGTEFLTLLDNSFPPSNPLYKLFTKQTVKISYKRRANMAQAVVGHNSTIKRKDRPLVEQHGCNCRGRPKTCPVGGKCLTSCVVYEATVTETQSGIWVTNTGITSKSFRGKLYEQNADMRKLDGRSKTCLSAHTWSLKDDGIDFNVTGKLKDRATAFNPITKQCRICLKEN